MQAIIDSGMTFGPFPEGVCFHIENSDCYRGLRDGIKMAEFLLLRQPERGPTVWVVEAKSSVPREYAAYIDEIRVKLTNAFMLGIAACLGRHPNAHTELPDEFKKLDLKVTDFRLLLVIKGEVPKPNLSNLQEALTLKLRPLIKTWGMSPTTVIVLNESMAEKHGLIGRGQS